MWQLPYVFPGSIFCSKREPSIHPSICPSIGGPGRQGRVPLAPVAVLQFWHLRHLRWFGVMCAVRVCKILGRGIMDLQNGCFPKIGGKKPKMDGENNGKPYCLMDENGDTINVWKYPYHPWVFWYIYTPEKKLTWNLVFYLFAKESHLLNLHFLGSIGRESWTHTVDGSEIRRSPVEVCRFFPLFQRFYASQVVQDFFHPQFHPWDRNI